MISNNENRIYDYKSTIRWIMRLFDDIYTNVLDSKFWFLFPCMLPLIIIHTSLIFLVVPILTVLDVIDRVISKGLIWLVDSVDRNLDRCDLLLVVVVPQMLLISVIVFTYGLPSIIAYQIGEKTRKKVVVERVSRNIRQNRDHFVNVFNHVSPTCDYIKSGLIKSNIKKHKL